MTRAFTDDHVSRDVVLDCIELATRAPSAGKSQGWHFVVLDGAHVAEFWDIALPAERRPSFAWPHLLSAPCIVLPCADAAAYTSRYSESDKAATGLGASVAAWPAPYWTIDASFATMTFLLALENEGLGALFFGVFHGEHGVRARFAIPESVQILGAIAVGHPRHGERQSGRSAGRRRRGAVDVTSFGAWNSRPTEPS